MRESLTVGSLFAQKHIPTDLIRQASIKYAKTAAELCKSNIKLEAVIETGKETLTAEHDHIVRSSGLIVYPGRHPESKHSLSTLEERNIGLYKMESSPWNDAVVLFALSTEKALAGQIPIHEEAFIPDKRIISITPPTQLSHSVGILGSGNIGQEIALQKLSEGRKVFYFSRSDNQKLDSLGAIKVSPEEMFDCAQTIFVTLPHTPLTHGIVDTHLLSRLGNNSRLISVSGGGVINERDLLKVMSTNRSLHVALDVVEGDTCDTPTSLLNPHNSPEVSYLAQEGRLILTPHIAYKTGESTKLLLFVITRPILKMAHEEKLNEVIDVQIPLEYAHEKKSYQLQRVI